MSLDKERDLALLAGGLLQALLELALPVKVKVLQDLLSQGRPVRAYQREEPDDLQQARQELQGLLLQIQPEPYKFYERWEVLLSTDRGVRRTATLIRDLWRDLPEQVRLGPESSGDLRRFTGLLQETRGICIKLQQDRHHAAHSKADTVFHSLSWHVAVLRLAEIPQELICSARIILQAAVSISPAIYAAWEEVIRTLEAVQTQALMAHVERAFVQLASERTGLAEQWKDAHPTATNEISTLQYKEISWLKEEVAILQDRFAALSGSIGPVLNCLSADVEGLSAQLQEIKALQMEASKDNKPSSVSAPIDRDAAIESLKTAYQRLQDLRYEITRELSPLEPDFRYYHCIVYRELILQSLREKVVSSEQLVWLSRETILRKTMRSGGDIGLSARLVDLQAKQFGGRIQEILDQVVYPDGAVNAAGLVGRDDS